MLHRFLKTIISFFFLISLISCSSGSQATANDTWSLVKLISKGDPIDNVVSETVESRNCVVPESKTTSCTAGTTNDLSIDLGGGIQVGTGFSGSIDSSVVSQLGIGEQSGESLPLDAPPPGFIYTYGIEKHYSVITGQVVALSQSGNEKTVTYSFHASCSINVISKQQTTCPNIQQGLISTPSPQPTIEPILPTPVTSYQVISLSQVGVAESGNLGLQAGMQKLANVQFEIGWLVTTQSESDPNKPDTVTINVNQEIPNPSKVHFLLQGGWATQEGEGFGDIVIAFADGRTLNQVLTTGYNIRDWSQTTLSLTAPNVQQAWKGVAWDGHTEGVVDMLTIEIPSDYRQSQITKIEIHDNSLSKLNSLDPGIYLWAITLE